MQNQNLICLVYNMADVHNYKEAWHMQKSYLQRDASEWDNKMGQYTKIEADVNAPKLFVRSPQ